MAANREIWATQPEDHDYPAAEQYLALLMPADDARKVVVSLRKQPIRTWEAKDILRASGLPLLGSTVTHVKNDLEKINAGKPLSPVLLVRGDARKRRPLIVADGYHRICASWILDENADIPCQIADLPS
jgi:hypothetical protein